MWKETPYFQELIYYFIYSLTPGKTVSVLPNKPVAKPTPQYETFPFNEDEFWGAGNTAATLEVGTFLAPLVEEWEGRPICRADPALSRCHGGRPQPVRGRGGQEGGARAVRPPAARLLRPGIRYFYVKDCGSPPPWW